MKNQSSLIDPKEVSTDEIEQTADWVDLLSDSAVDEITLRCFSAWLREAPHRERLYNSIRQTWDAPELIRLFGRAAYNQQPPPVFSARVGSLITGIREFLAKRHCR